MNRVRTAALLILAVGVGESAAQPIIGSQFGFTPVVSSASQPRSLSTLRFPERMVTIRGSDDPDIGNITLLGPDNYDPANALFYRVWSEDLGAGYFRLTAEYFAYPVLSEEEGEVIVSLERGGDLFQRGLRSSIDNHPFDGGGGLAIGYELVTEGMPIDNSIELASPTFLIGVSLLAADAEDNVLGIGEIDGDSVSSEFLNADGSWKGLLNVVSSDFINLDVNRAVLTLDLFAPAAIPEPSSGVLTVVLLTACGASRRLSR